MQRTRHELVAALVVLSLAGCSFALVPRVHPKERPVRCTTSRVAPAADGLIAAGAVVAAAIVACEDPLGLSCLDRTAGVAALAAVALVYVMSAATGIARADSCARARAAAQADPFDLVPDD